MTTRTSIVTAKIVATFLAGFMLHVAYAEAGTYKLYSCNVPGRATTLPSTAPWTVELDGLNTFAYNECASGGSFGIALNVRFMRAFGMARLTLARPPAGPQAAIGIVRYRTWIKAELAGTGAPAFIDDGGAFAPPGGANADESPWVSEAFLPTNPAVHIRLHCSAGDCYLDSGRPLQVRGVEADLHEDGPPSGVIEGGTLTGGRIEGGRATVSYSATDPESGVARVEVLLDGAVVAGDNLDGNPVLCPHTDWNACPLRHSGDLAIDVSRMPAGAYSAALRVTDAAGNRSLVAAPQPVVIGTAVLPRAGAQLTAGFPGSRASYTTNFGRSVQVRGQLTDLSGQPIPFAHVAVVDKRLTSGRPRIATTDVRGRFTYLASGRKPSRSIEFQYFARPDDSKPVASRRLKLRVRAGSLFKLALSGVVVRYSGRVISHPLPRGGKRVFVQGRAVGGVWQRFATRRTDSKGRFSGRYRLRVRRPGVKLQFRVEIPKQAGYPFAARKGPAVTRVVR